MQNFDRQIQMGPEWFQTVKKDYSNWRFAWVREAGQNSLDAGCTQINVTTVSCEGSDPSEEYTKITWQDNGCGMTEDVLVNKFMVVGGSDKRNSDSNSNTGGFGIAKLILAFAQESYTIRTTTIEATGRGAQYAIKTGLPPVRGTTFTVVMKSFNRHVNHHVRQWARLSAFPKNVFINLNGQTLPTFRNDKRNVKLTSDWCTVSAYKNLSNANNVDPGMFIRINGQYMFDEWHDTAYKNKVHIMVDITDTNSTNIFTSNRDSLQYHMRRKLNALTQTMLDDPDKIRKSTPKITLYKGKKGKVKFKNETSTPKQSQEKLASLVKILAQELQTKQENELIRALTDTPNTINTKAAFVEFARTLLKGHNVVIVNELTCDIPTRMLPTEDNRAQRLFNAWTLIVQMVGTVLDRSEVVTTGFVFSDSSRALYRKDDETGHQILVNPATLTETGRNLKFYWPQYINADSFYEMVAVATHEITHIDHSRHDETYAAALTYNLGKVLAKKRAFETIRKLVNK